MADEREAIASVLAEAQAIRRSGEQISTGISEIADAISSLAIVLATGKQELLSVKEAAEILGVSDDTIRRAVNGERLPSFRIGPERTGIRIHRSDLAEYQAALARANLKRGRQG